MVSSTKELSLTQAAGMAFPPPELREHLIAAAERGASFNSGFNENHSQIKGSDEDEDDEKKRNYLTAVATNSNIALEIGNFVFSALEVSGALDSWSQDQQDQLELAQMIDDANQNLYLRHENGTLFTPAEIAAYEEQNLVCIADPYDLADDITSIQGNIDAAAQAKALLDSGQSVDLNTLPQEVADQLITQRIEAQIANGETVDLSTIPPEFKDTAINAVVNAEWDAAHQAAYTTAGLTEDQVQQGGLLYDEDARAVYDSEMSTWEETRRAELSAEAGIDYTPPAPSADTTTTAPQQTNDDTLDVNDPNTWMPPTAGM